MKNTDQILLENIYQKLIHEANLAFDDSLMSELNAILDSKDIEGSSPIRSWFKTQYLKWFKSPQDDDKKPVVPHSYKEEEPEWMKRPEVVDFKGFEESQKQKIAHMVDYFKTLSDIDLKSLYKEPLKVIEDKMSKWEKTLSKKMEKAKLSPLVKGTDFEILTSTKESNGAPMRWVKLLTKEAFKFEGDSMGHCVGGYNPAKQGLSIISLYDEDNLPHVTLEIQNKNIKQIKGKQNDRPVEKYQEACIKFVRYLVDNKQYEVSGDGENIGMMNFENKYYFKDSDNWKKIFDAKILPMQQKAFEELKSRIVEVTSEFCEYVLEYLKPLRSKYV